MIAIFLLLGKYGGEIGMYVRWYVPSFLFTYLLMYEGKEGQWYLKDIDVRRLVKKVTGEGGGYFNDS